MKLRRPALSAVLVCSLALGGAVPAFSGPAVVSSLPAQSQQANPSDAVELYTQDIPPLGEVDGVSIDGAGYGSSFVAQPGSDTIFYGLTDRGPNIDGPDDSKIEPLPDFTPAIGKFRLCNGKAELLKSIPLKAADGTPYNGQVNTEANTGETIYDLDGNVLPASPYGYDPEGLAVMPDGTFWVSDEYGPFVTHFTADGRQIERLSPFDGTLPAELQNRRPNRGMEGLTVTPDGRKLVGIMQSALNAPDAPKSKNVNALRIVSIDLQTREVAQYVYLLHSEETPTTSVSEIAALTNDEFLVIERDGKMQPGANKKIFKVDLSDATDVGQHSTVPNSKYRANDGGLLVGGKTIEKVVGKSGTAEAQRKLEAVGIEPVASSLFLDVSGLVTAIDPRGYFFGHDKVEGVAVLDGGKRIVIANDSDFGIDSPEGNDEPPFRLAEKTLPDGSQDTGQLLDVDMTRVPAQFKG